MPGEAPPIAVDNASYSMELALGPEDFQSETTSIASAIARGRLENGRRYQATKEDDYWGPSDEKQFEAFEISHILFLVLDQDQENPLFRSPIGDSPKHILDIGTGQGSWAIDVADSYRPRSGPLPPPVTWMPPNCVFEVDDVLREWTWRQPFDLIHLRMMYGAFDNDGWNQVYKRAYNALQPGGWIEQVELDVRLYSDDGTLAQDSFLAGWGETFIGCSERAGRSLLTQETMLSEIEKVGFVDIHEKLIKIPLGPWARDRTLKEAGQLQLAHWNTALEGWAMWLLTKFGEPTPWTTEEVQVYLAKIRLELKDPHRHAYGFCRRVWAMKPLKQEVEDRGEEAQVKAEEGEEQEAHFKTEKSKSPGFPGRSSVPAEPAGRSTANYFHPPP
ncbi:hypothetical protein N7462_001381 [Penicillium macrosclerotiorum]|uniref:uncharacterized protein n=1 Tax=Penicillium macrosclerotiorum TaxID=303699 RepID=UPI002548340C|nr:uncharacterized protein N7462_001381 [Penicillium macrosclerotiorum]KAJ5691958.1 hypothetical protein N7462_001381 [Penicillium macrosclerotiorum]